MTKPILIDRPNVSLAWAEAFVAVRAASAHRIAPLAISFTGFENGNVTEDDTVRTALDAALSASEMRSVHTVANTIFPQSLWKRAKGDRAALYAAYLENLPDYVAMDSANRRGLYFGRLIGFDIDPKTGDKLPNSGPDALEDGNQLEFIIQRCKKGIRASALQAAVFDPDRDHLKGPYMGFPCLQHLTFVPDFKNELLALNAFYATQQLFEKGYGNYLGLARLGLFVAQATGLNLERVTCFVGIEKIDSDGKPTPGAALDALVAACEALINGGSVAEEVLT